MNQLYATDFVSAATATASSRRDPAHARAQRRRTATSTPPGLPPKTRRPAQIEFDLGQARTFNVARVQEDISLGERVLAYHVEILDGDSWRPVTAGQAIGHKQRRRFPAVTAQRVRLVIDKAAAQPAISEFGLHWNPLAPAGSGPIRLTALPPRPTSTPPARNWRGQSR